MNTDKYIQKLIEENNIVLFMKGTPNKPECGFSARAVALLKICGVKEKQITYVNVLEDEKLRQGIKDFSRWPTIPQLYIEGVFIGGTDIMSDLFASGELKKFLP